MNHVSLTSELILQAYANGVFPMAESREDETLFWVDPKERGIIPLDRFHISRSLRRLIRQERYHVSFDTAFEAVMEGCADREETWINGLIFDLYSELFDMGFGHSVEIWDGERLVGGSYGLVLGSAYFGESMFSRVPSASKIALAYLVAHLKRCGFTLFDTQFLTDHLATLGGIEIPRSDYRRRLNRALERKADFQAVTTPLTPQEVLQLNGQMS